MIETAEVADATIRPHSRAKKWKLSKDKINKKIAHLHETKTNKNFKSFSSQTNALIAIYNIKILVNEKMLKGIKNNSLKKMTVRGVVGAVKWLFCLCSCS